MTCGSCKHEAVRDAYPCSGCSHGRNWEPKTATQQVAHPTASAGVEAYDDPVRIGRDAKGAMMAAHALAPSELSHPDRMAWMADYFLRNYKAAGVEARKPLSEEEMRHQKERG